MPLFRILTGAASFLFLPIAALAQGVEHTPDPALAAQLAYHAVPPPNLWGMRLTPVLFALGLVVAALVYSSVSERRKHELLARFIDKGQEIPPQLLPRAPSPLGAKRAGVLLTALGVGLGAAFVAATGEWQQAAWSLIPLLMGAASFANAAFLYPDSGKRQ